MEQQRKKLRIYSVVTIMILDVLLSAYTYTSGSMAPVALLMFTPAIVSFIYKLIFKVKYENWHDLSIIRSILTLILGITLATLIILGVNEIGYLYGANPNYPTIFGLRIIVSAFTEGAIAPFGEEYGWRGTIFRTYIDDKDLTMGTIKTSLIWGMFHVPMVLALSSRMFDTSIIMGLTAVLVQFLATVFAGLWFNYAYYKSGFGAVIITTLLHSFWNIFNTARNLSIYEATNWNNIVFDGEGIAGVLIFMLLSAIFYKQVFFMNTKDNSVDFNENDVSNEDEVKYENNKHIDDEKQV